MSEWKINKEEKKKLSVMISEDKAEIFENIKDFICAESETDKVSDSQVFEVIIKIASKNSAFKRFMKTKNKE
jgi:hypothetical protein